MSTLSEAAAILGSKGGAVKTEKKLAASLKNMARARMFAEKSHKKIEAAKLNIAIGRRRLAEIRASKKDKKNT
jgi:hypothetical protein